MLTGGVRAAAEVLHISQPAVSKGLGQLRRATTLELFETVKGRLLPTPEALRLYEEAEALWRGVERLRDLSINLARPQGGSLRLAVSASVAPHLVPQAIAKLLEHSPDTRVYMEILIAPAISEALISGAVDLAVAAMAGDHPNIAAVAKYSCGLACVVPTAHRLARRDAIFARDLKGERMVVSTADSQYGQVLQRCLGKTVVTRTVEVRNSATACWFVQAGAGIAITDLAAVAGNSHPGLTVIPFRTREKVAVDVLRRKNRPMSMLEHAFCERFDQCWKAALGATG